MANNVGTPLSTALIKVYLIVPSIVIINLADKTPAPLVAVIYCGDLNNLFAIVYFFVPKIIPCSISNKKLFVMSGVNLANALSNGLVKNIVGLIPDK